MVGVGVWLWVRMEVVSELEISSGWCELLGVRVMASVLVFGSNGRGKPTRWTPAFFLVSVWSLSIQQFTTFPKIHL